MLAQTISYNFRSPQLCLQVAQVKLDFKRGNTVQSAATSPFLKQS